MVTHSEHPSYASFPVFKAIDPNPKSRLDRFLNIFADVRGGEGAGVFLLFVNVFVLLSSTYLVKVMREPLILEAGGSKAKSNAAALQALILLFVVPIYGWVSTRIKRSFLLSGLAIFFASNLVLFYALVKSGTVVGKEFYLWAGVFNTFVISQFWAFANDLYTEPQGKRLFAIIAVGSSIGAIVGSSTTTLIAKLDLFAPLLAAALLLAISSIPTWITDRRVAGSGGETQKKASQSPLAAGDGFILIFKDRYLILIAVLVLLLNIINTSGEILLSDFVAHHAEITAGTGDSPAVVEARQRVISSFTSGYQTSFNILAFIIQAFIVSRLFRYIGVGGALFILPAIAFAGYAVLLAVPIMGVIRSLKILENGCTYSVQNTTGQALFLPTSREVKYKAKAAIDTFFMRGGDMLQAGIYLLTIKAGFDMSKRAVVNLALTLVWFAVALLLYREHRRRISISSAAPTQPTA